MDSQATATTYLKNTLDIYRFSENTSGWTGFWQQYFDRRLSFQENDLNTFIQGRCQEISHFLSFLQKEDPAAKQFLTELPLSFSKVTFDWPPTPEQVRELMAD